jgi:hypothetical protein
MILYYARAADPTLIMPVKVLASEQIKATTSTADKIIKLLDYCTTYQETKNGTKYQQKAEQDDYGIWVATLKNKTDSPMVSF